VNRRPAPDRSAGEVLLPGSHSPLGALWDGTGTNFALWSAGAQAVDLCLFDAHGTEHRHRLEETTHQVWHGRLPGVGPGQRYGYRVHGTYDPLTGLRHNPAKLLLDPYTRAVDGNLALHPSLFGYVGDAVDSVARDAGDSAPYVPRGVVVHDPFPWDGDRPLRTSWSDTVIYEVHVKGATAAHPDVPPSLRGTYAGLAHPAFIEHLQSLGVSAVELLPVHHFVSEPHLMRRGLTNYWGYNTLGYFAPHAAYSSAGSGGGQVTEFKTMVKQLHAAGIEVILDVVYNHTAEGDHTGPTLSFKGIDNAGYYRLDGENRARYTDYTGCGNTLDVRRPAVLALLMDSLRYWVTEMHVDGFRFDLASALARSMHDVDRLSAFFDVVHQDPVVSNVKLIAEPWDVGPGGYQVGNFPVLWSEWNGMYRDVMRDFWRGDASLADFTERFAGSSDLYESDGRKPFASVNFVTAHDGFTLCDLVSYNDKHNEANQENGEDGTDDNRSWNCGAEGPTDDHAVRELRARQRRNFVATLMLSQGVPMLLGGEELCRSQHGNNNGWCQDNELSWYDWNLSEEAWALLDWTKRLIALRRSEPVFRREHFLEGDREDGRPDVWWFRRDGRRMTRRDWENAELGWLGVFLSGDHTDMVDAHGQPVNGDSFLVILNVSPEDVMFRLPAARLGARWTVELTSADPRLPAGERTLRAREELYVSSRSITVLRRA
jgi:isoamylase